MAESRETCWRESLCTEAKHTPASSVGNQTSCGCWKSHGTDAKHPTKPRLLGQPSAVGRQELQKYTELSCCFNDASYIHETWSHLGYLCTCNIYTHR